MMMFAFRTDGLVNRVVVMLSCYLYVILSRYLYVIVLSICYLLMLSFSMLSLLGIRSMLYGHMENPEREPTR